MTASTGNTEGFFYVRVQGHDDKVFDAANGLPPRPRARHGIQDCVDLDTFPTTPTLPPAGGSPRTVIVTDTNKLSLLDDPEVEATRTTPTWHRWTTWRTAPTAWSSTSRPRRGCAPCRPRRPTAPGAPTPTNLVADAIKDIVDSYRTTDDAASSTS